MSQIASTLEDRCATVANHTVAVIGNSDYDAALLISQMVAPTLRKKHAHAVRMGKVKEESPNLPEKVNRGLLLLAVTVINSRLFIVAVGSECV